MWNKWCGVTVFCDTLKGSCHISQGPDLGGDDPPWRIACELHCGVLDMKFKWNLKLHLLRPANEICEGYVFTRVCLSTGVCVWQGGMHGRGGHVWQGCVHGRGVQAGGVQAGGVQAGGVHGRGHGGVCVVGGHACHGRYHGIRSMSGRYASYWNAFLFDMNFYFIIYVCIVLCIKIFFLIIWKLFLKFMSTLMHFK